SYLFINIFFFIKIEKK
ncbi:hypothetical protein AALP_AA5G025700, partial [Arabis alpina]